MNGIVCVYIHTLCMYTVYTRICKKKYIYMYIGICIHIYVYIHTLIYTYTWVCVYIHMHVYTYTCIYVDICYYYFSYYSCTAIEIKGKKIIVLRVKKKLWLCMFVFYKFDMFYFSNAKWVCLNSLHLTVSLSYFLQTPVSDWNIIIYNKYLYSYSSTVSKTSPTSASN